MSIHYRRYARYTGVLEPIRTRFLAIAENDLRRVWTDKWAKRLAFFAWSPALFYAMMLYLTFVAEKAVGIELGGFAIHESLLKSELPFIAVILAGYGAGLISRDIETRALTLYFTRPVDALQYHLGKLCACMSLVLAVTLLPGIVLALAKAFLSESFEVLPLLDGIWRLAVASLGMAFTSSSLILLLSSSGWSSRFVGAAWLALFLMLELTRTVLSSALGQSALLDVISLGRLFTNSVECLFGETEHVPSLVALWGFGVFFAAALRVRLISLEKVRA